MLVFKCNTLLSQIKKLYLTNLNINAIPYIGTLEELEINYCRNIKEIPYYPKLKKLKISYCYIIKIPYCPNLKKLEINYCKNIKEIPYYPNLKELFINNSLVKNYLVNNKVNLNIDNNLINILNHY